MAKKTLVDDLLDIIQSICFHLPLWAIFIVALAPTVFVFFITALAISPLTNLATAEPNLASALPLFTSLVTYALCLVAGLSGWRARRKRKDMVAQTRTIEDLRRLSWREFELLVGEAYRKRGYDVSEGRGNAPDGGIDLDVRAPNGQRVLIQCKHWKSAKIGVKIVREALGVLHKVRAAKAVVVGTGTFTQEAQRFAEGEPVELIDGAELIKQLAETDSTAVAQENPTAIPQVALDNEPENHGPSPNEAFMPPPSQIKCPKCGGDMVKRTARRGPNAGEEFLGCGNFPKCRHTQTI